MEVAVQWSKCLVESNFSAQDILVAGALRVSIILK
jgi:hypothetical protein